jgi:hypothetical protein
MINKIKSLYKDIKNLIIWIPVIWNDRDWDEKFMLQILHKKLDKMEKFFRSDKAWSANSNKKAHRIMVAKNLCKRLIKGSYLENATIEYDKKYDGVDIEDIFKDLPNGFREYIGDANKKRDNAFDKCCDHSIYMENRDWNLLWDIIKKHGNGWWD